MGRPRGTVLGTGKVLRAQVSDEIYEAIDDLAQRHGVNRAIIVRWALAQYFGIGEAPPAPPLRRAS